MSKTYEIINNEKKEVKISKPAVDETKVTPEIITKEISHLQDQISAYTQRIADLQFKIDELNADLIEVNKLF
jgi:uncharacterized coiled-coil DUF342 family protein